MNWYKLKLVGIKDSIIRKFMKELKTFDEIFKLTDYQMVYYFKCDEDEIKKIRNINSFDCSAELEKLKKYNVKILSYRDKIYPQELKNISQPPIFLYYKGDVNLLNGKKIAVVGTRKCTSYGKVGCEKIVDGLVNVGITIISGLAIGIDAICHKKTLEKNGKTIAVVGSGLDIIYPKVNKNLWEEIERKGLILSEYPLGTSPTNFNFPMRNRIIVGLAKGVLVVESQKRGGSLITASIALEEGREVFALPGDMFAYTSEGCNDLIKNSQAKLVTEVGDILEEYGWSAENSHYSTEILTNDEKIVYDELVIEKSLDELACVTGFDISKLLMLLMNLEIKKATISVGGGKYRRKN